MCARAPAIRPYTPQDRAAVVALHRWAIAQAGAGLTGGPWEADMQDIEGSYCSPDRCMLVACAGPEVVGMGALRPFAAPGTCEIKRMRVAPAYQGRGLGRRILEALEGRARAMGYTRAVLDTLAQAAPARALYEDAGYRFTHAQNVRDHTTLWYAKAL